MNCADFEILLCDYVDGTLRGEQKSAVEQHIAECEVCAEMAKDASAAVSFMERVAVVDPPQELMTQLMFQVGAAQQRYKPSVWRKFTRWFEPVRQPRVAMGMAMTVFSFALLGRVTGVNVRQLEAKDLNPVAVYHAAEDRVVGAWNSAVKYYESARVVYEIQTRLREIREARDQEQQQESGNAATPRQESQKKENKQ